jgi:hypothetical protein
MPVGTVELLFPSDVFSLVDIVSVLTVLLTAVGLPTLAAESNQDGLCESSCEC